MMRIFCNRNYFTSLNATKRKVERAVLSLQISSTSISPSTKTTVILKNIGNKATAESFKACVSGINFRRAEVQPGCSLHVVSETDADYLVQKLSGNANIQVISLLYRVIRVVL